ncbi:MAG: nitroreductase family protein [Methylococcales bacterium]|nr:nitroreductase family protein [Methylococcales bacterium]
MQTKPAITRTKIHDLLASRWSPRAFNADLPVSQADIIALLEAARWAPSCFNDQPWRFIVCNKTTDATAWQNAFGLLAEKNKLWAKNAPLLVLSAAMANFNHNSQPNRWAMYDTGAAALSLCLQANALGLICHQMGGFDAARARQVFGLPEDCTPMAMIAVGYQAEAATLNQDFQDAEQGPRSRAELPDRFYFGNWGMGNW